MTDKPKKSKRITQWQFLFAWIGGQFLAFFVLAVFGIIFINLMESLGFSLDSLAYPVQTAIAGAGLGYFSGWAQQWAIRKRFGRHIHHWRLVSAVLTGLAFALVIPFVRMTGFNAPQVFENPDMFAGIVMGTYAMLFGVAGIGQTLLLRKHVKHSWLFFLSVMVGAIMFAVPSLRDITNFAPSA